MSVVYWTVFTLLFLCGVLSSSASAAGLPDKVVSMSEIGEHPNAAVQPTDAGKAISKLVLFDGKLYAGYGDYNANTGPIEINPFDLNSRSFDGVQLSVPTESVGNLKEINGKLYATTIDPTCANSCSAGYAVYTPGVGWDMKTPIVAEHLYDIATLTGTDLWLFGATGGDTSTAWRSTDDGDTWNVVRTQSYSPGADNSERFYWGAVLGGAMYMQSNYSMYDRPIDWFDGANWQTQASSAQICGTGTVSKGPNPVVFDGKIVCADSGYINIFDGTNITHINNNLLLTTPCDPVSLGDLVVRGGVLYVLCGDYDLLDGENNALLLRTDDLINWSRISGIPEAARSLEVDTATQTLYVGTANSRIFSGQLAALNSGGSSGGSASGGASGSSTGGSATQQELAMTGDWRGMLLAFTALCLVVVSVIIDSSSGYRHVQRVGRPRL